MIESYLCTTCTSEYVYDYQDEELMDDSFTPMPDTTTSFTLENSAVTVGGFYATDVVCLE